MDFTASVRTSTAAENVLFFVFTILWYKYERLLSAAPKTRREIIMRRTGLVYDDRFLLHDTGPGHPERPERLTAIRRGIEDAGLLPRPTLIEPVPARLKWVEAVHSPKYIYGFEEA